MKKSISITLAIIIAVAAISSIYIIYTNYYLITPQGINLKTPERKNLTVSLSEQVGVSANKP